MVSLLTSLDRFVYERRMQEPKQYISKILSTAGHGQRRGFVRISTEVGKQHVLIITDQRKEYLLLLYSLNGKERFVIHLARLFSKSSSGGI